MNKADLMEATELEAFIAAYDFNAETLAHLLGVTRPAVDHWLTDRRPVPPTAARLIRLFKKYPELIEKF